MKKNRKRTNSRNNTDGRSARNRNTYQRSTSCPLSLPGAPKIDYKNIELLKNKVKIHLVGTGPDKDEFMQQCKNLDVIYHGYKVDVLPYYISCDLAVLPS